LNFNRGTGLFIHEGGLLIIDGQLNLGLYDTSQATYELSGGNLLVVGSISGNGLFRITGGTLAVVEDSGFLDIDALAFGGGTLTQVSGVRGAFLHEGGAWSPGDSSGAFTVGADYSISDGATLLIELGGRNRGVSYDAVDVNGTARLAGTLRARLGAGFLPQAGDVFRIMTYGNRNGAFSAYAGLEPVSGLELVPLYGADSLELVATVDGDVDDVDGDRIPNAWELIYFGGMTNAAASLDPDGDGFNNLEEYIAGTVPTNGLSYLRATGIQEDEVCRIHFDSSTNRVYSLGFNPGLTTTGWARVTGQERIRGRGADMSLVDTNLTQGTAGMYRIEVELP
jgi:hypothetical protein